MSDKTKIIAGITVIVVLAIYHVFIEDHGKTRADYEYEAYCDSIWESDPDYYFDVICESDEYDQYLEKHGEWWSE